MRNPRRTAATASALMIGLGLVAMVAILSASLKASFDAALAETLAGRTCVMTTSSFTPFSQDVAAKTREVDGVAAVSELRQGGFRVDGTDRSSPGSTPRRSSRSPTLDVDQDALEALEGGDVARLRRDRRRGQRVGGRSRSCRRRSRPAGDDR